MYLSILIPTYNRSKSLKKTLTALVGQVEKITSDEVELIVSDNDSTDDTKSVVEAFIDEFKSVRLIYFKNVKNIGFDANVNEAISHASGEYSWLLSDDDEILDSAVQVVISNLRRYGGSNLRFAFINYSIHQCGVDMPSGYEGVLTKLIDGRDLFSEVKLINTFVSSNIFRTECWRGVEVNKYFGSLWVHVFAAREVLKIGKALIIGEPQIRMMQPGLLESRREKKDSAEYLDYYTDAHFKLCNFVRSLTSHGYSDATVDTLSRHCTSGEYGHIFNLKLVQNKSEFWRSVVFAKMLVQAGMNNAIGLMGKIALLFIPSFLFRIARSAKRYIQGRN